MRVSELTERLESCPVIAAIRDNKWQAALESPAEVLFYLEPHLCTIQEKVAQAHNGKKALFVHLDLAEGIGKDREPRLFEFCNSLTKNFFIFFCV